MIMMRPPAPSPGNGGRPTTMAIGEEGGGPGMPVGIRVAGPPPSNRPPQLPPPPQVMWGRPPAPQPPMYRPQPPVTRPPMQQPPMYRPQPPVTRPPVQQPPLGRPTTMAIGEEGGGQFVMGPNQWLPFFNQGNRPRG